MKKFDGPDKGLFEDAERIKPPPGLWRVIEARAGLTAGGAARDSGAQQARADAGAGETDAPEPGFRGGRWVRMAASVALAAGVLGLLGLGMFFKDRFGQGNAATASAVQTTIDTVAMAGTAATPADTETEIVDPELLGWHADLGEMDEVAQEADEAEEIL